MIFISHDHFTGYQKELTYQHYDGSFSAFGNNDDSGSTWLTAFVVKSFAQASPYIFIDTGVVRNAISWLLEQFDDEAGVFAEPGNVIHKEMQVRCKFNNTTSVYRCVMWWPNWSVST